MLGAVAAGPHSVSIIEDPDLTSPSLRGKAAAGYAVTIEQRTPDAGDYEAIARAPFVYARPDTVGRFTDVPVLMWYEIEPTARGTRFRYTVIFTNEDGGTPADRLMATWGRTTDIEYLYSVELDPAGAVISEDIQGPEHEILPFTGTREGRHPLLWVSTDNNMVLGHGHTQVRYASLPVFAELTNVARESVMDAQPWTYDLMAKELMREGKIVADAPPGRGAIPDPRRYAYFEGCGTLGGRALTFAVQVEGQWIQADRGMPEYRIARDGCFRGAVPLPANATAADIRAVRVYAFTRQDKPGAARVIFTRLNRLFTFGDAFVAGTSVLHWEGKAELVPDGAPLEIAVP